MKVPIERKSDDEMREAYPIADRLPDWYFRFSEISNNVWLAEGKDVWGRTVSCQGSDPDELLSDCIARAELLEEP